MPLKGLLERAGMKFRLGCAGRVSCVLRKEKFGPLPPYAPLWESCSSAISDLSRDLRTELSPEERMKSCLAAEGDVRPGEGGTGEWHHASPCLPASCLDTKLPASPGSPESFAYKRIGVLWGNPELCHAKHRGWGPLQRWENHPLLLLPLPPDTSPMAECGYL